MNRQPRFEICRGDDGWWARFRAANGRVVFVTETYERRRGAVRAINVIAGGPSTGSILDRHVYGVRDTGYGVEVEFGRHGLLEIREVDER